MAVRCGKTGGSLSLDDFKFEITISPQKYHRRIRPDESGAKSTGYPCHSALARYLQYRSAIFPETYK
ncbi:hypothetical protein [Paraburkholderia adhaesiva]|uniref:hypothetical protein n=1 Tax=Paraburkholderia adhaesiva TaxID=2883244 RepID=UPI001F3DA6F1|nr:hypothetical protein [Paraburkholderia adhaesiva]